MDYRQLAYQKAVKYGLNPDLFVRQIEAESAFNPNAVSSAGAIGLGQLMPATARELGVDPSDPDQNLEGAARYMRQQMDRFGRPDLALAAYNAGPSRVAKLGRVPNITETQNYVAKIMGTNPAMSLSTKDAAMAPTMTPTAKPEEQQSLWDRLTGRSEATGLNPLEAFAAGLDALILPEMRMGDVIRQQGAQRAKTAKEETQRNKSIEYLKSRADAGDDVAAKILGAVSTGTLPVGTGISTYLSQSLKQSTTTDTTDYKNYLEFKKTNPNVTFEEFYTKYKNKPDIQSKGVYRDKSGNIIGEVNYDASTGQFFQFDENGQRQTLNMKELTPVTDATFAKTIPSIKEFGDLSEKLQSDIGSMRQLEKYMTAINNTNEGFARLADDLAASAKTLLSSYLGADYASLAPEELNLRISRGLQQGLIGRFRLETVGGGVMTEQDALRIIQNLGGDVNLLQNKEVVAKQIENLFQAKKSSFERDKKRYDIALDQVYRSQGFEDIEPYKFNEDVFKLKSPVADQSKQTMTDDALLSGAAGKAGPALQQYLEGLSDADFARLQELMKNGE